MEHSSLDLYIKSTVVYTTKLDSMPIFNYGQDLSSMDFKTIISIIENESKPQLSYKRKWEPDLMFAEQENITYETLEKKVKIINEKSIERMRNNTINLLSLCKPVRIVLNDIKNSFKESSEPTRPFLKKILLSKTELTKRFGAYLQNKDASDTDSDGDDVIFVKSLVCQYKTDFKPSNKIQSSLKHIFAVIHDIKGCVNYVYGVASKGLIREYETFHAVTDEAAFLSRSRDALNYQLMEKYSASFCCWYNRVGLVQSLKFCNQETKCFMIIPHSCDPYECKCCCRKYTLHRSKPYQETPPSYSYLFNNWLFNHIVRSNLPLNKFFIQTSLSTPIPSSQKVENTKLEQKDKIGMRSWIEIEKEFYKLRADDHIIFIPKYNMNNPENIAAKVGPKLCCWYSRNQAVERLVGVQTLSIHLNLLKTPHKCRFGACICCCKPVNNNKEKLIFYSISQRYTGEIVKKRINMKLKFPVCESRTSVSNDPISLSKSSATSISNNTVTPTTAKLPPILPKSASFVPCPRARLNQFSRSSLPHYQPNVPPLRNFIPVTPVAPAFKTPSVLSTCKEITQNTTINNAPPNLPPLTYFNNQTNSTAVITKIILEKFKDIKLVNNDNAVSISIGVPLKQLDLTELKLLESLLESFTKSAHYTDTQKTKLFMEMSCNAVRKNRSLLRSFLKQVANGTNKERSSDRKTELDADKASKESAATEFFYSEDSVKPGPSGMLRVKTPQEISRSKLTIT